MEKQSIQSSNKSKGLTTQQIVYIGMFTALLAVLAQVSIPMPSGVPITLQTFAVALTGVVLSWQLGLASMGIYILLGAIGVPVFAGFSGGVQVLVSYTGGFIWGFIGLIIFSGIAANKKSKILGIALALIGLFICHVLGVLQFSFVMGMGIKESIFMASLPYVIKDVISVILAYVIGKQIRNRLKRASLLG